MLTRYSSVQGGCYADNAYVNFIGTPLLLDDDVGSTNVPVNRATTLGWAIYIVIALVTVLVVGILLRIVFFAFGKSRRGGAVVGFD
jgi:hypothetical protein